MADNHRVMVYTGQSLFKWHMNRLVIPNERLKDEDKKRIGYFIYHNDQWLLVNEGMPDLYDNVEKKNIPIGEAAVLTDGAQYLLSKEEGGRLVSVQLVEN